MHLLCIVLIEASGEVRNHTKEKTNHPSALLHSFSYLCERLTQNIMFLKLFYLQTLPWLPATVRKMAILLLIFLPALQSAAKRTDEFTVLQWNIWQEGTMVKGGYDAIVDEIVRLQPDFVTLSEVRNYKNTNFTLRLTNDLQKRGLQYYSFYSYDTGLLSRYPITDSLTVFPCEGDHGSIYRLLCEAKGHRFAVYTAHLDYQNDAYYDVRGYSGVDWTEIPIPTSAEEVLRRSDISLRDDAIALFIKQAEKDEKAGYNIILGGDFNEPSHLDWTAETANLYDHNGLVIPWTVTTMLEKAGFSDAYRTYYPNIVKYPGFTYPSDNPDVEVKRLTWAPKADERDRIDYLFLKGKGIKIKDCRIFGPEKSIAKSVRTPNPMKENFITPLGIWPTDHKGVWMKIVLPKASKKK